MRQTHRDFRTSDPSPRRRAAGVWLLALALGACNPAEIPIQTDRAMSVVIIENQSQTPVVAARYGLGEKGDAESADAVRVEVGARVSLGTVNDAAAWLPRVVLMDVDCSRIGADPIPVDGKLGSTVITIKVGGLVSVRSGGDVDPGGPAALTDVCQAEVKDGTR